MLILLFIAVTAAGTSDPSSCLSLLTVLAAISANENASL